MSAIRHIRRNILKLSQTDFGALAETTQSTVSRWEDGSLSPRLDEIERIIGRAGGRVSIADFVARSEMAAPAEKAS